MRKRSKKCLKMHVECTKRERRMSILLSDEEQLIVDRYLEKYKITNKSRWLRETARAHNLTETLNDVTAHAEMQAITAAANVLGGKYLNECTLYVTVEPCVMCAGAIAWAQTGKLVFGAEDEKRGYQKYAGSALHPKTVVVKGVMADECATLMKEFFAAKRK